MKFKKLVLNTIAVSLLSGNVASITETEKYKNDAKFTAGKTATGVINAIAEGVIDQKLKVDKDVEAKKALIKQILGNKNSNAKRIVSILKIVADAAVDLKWDYMNDMGEKSLHQEIYMKAGHKFVPTLATQLAKNAITGKDIKEVKSYLVALVKTSLESKLFLVGKHDESFKAHLLTDLDLTSKFFDLNVILDPKNPTKYLNFVQGVEGLVKFIVGTQLDQLLQDIIADPNHIIIDSKGTTKEANAKEKFVRNLINKVTGKIATKIVMEILSPVIKKLAQEVSNTVANDIKEEAAQA